MSEFSLGDVVDISDDGSPHNYSGRGTVVGFAADMPRVRFDEPAGRGTLTYPTYRVTRVVPQFVNVVTSRSIWVTLPGDNAGHRLTNDDALTLLRQLEEALS